MPRSLSHMLYRLGIRPNWPGSPPQVETTTEVRPCAPDPSYSIGIIRITGSIPANGSARLQGQTLLSLIPPCQADAVIVDLSQIECGSTSEWGQTFAGGVRMGSKMGNATFVFPASWPRPKWMHHLPASVQETIAWIEDRRRRALREARLAQTLDLTRAILRGGLGAIRFGMSIEQVQQLMGPPDHAENDDEEQMLEYSDPNVSFGFRALAERGVCLTTIRVTNWDVYVRGIPLLGQDEFITARALERFGVRAKGKSRFRGWWWMSFTHGLRIHGDEGPPHEAEWTILPDSERTEDIDWSGKDCIG